MAHSRPGRPGWSRGGEDDLTVILELKYIGAPVWVNALFQRYCKAKLHFRQTIRSVYASIEVQCGEAI